MGTFTLVASGLNSEKYNVLRELGRGGMGVVYLAEDVQLKRYVALKVLYEHLYREAAFVERFQEEARSVSTIHHPNIVCVHGLERSNGVLAIDMEYVEGISLDQRAGCEAFSPHIAVAIARDVLGGLAVCHGIGVVHRDIKPSNILLDENGTAKLTDFGLATAYASHLEATVRGSTSSGFYMGTPRYMPVEAWEGGNPKPCWDTYAFGVVLYEMLTGTVAFPGENPLAIMKKHLSGGLASVRTLTPGLSEELAELVDLLVCEPDEDTEFDGGNALRLLQETPEYTQLEDSKAVATVAIPRVRRTQLWKRVKRKRPMLIGVATAVAATVVIALALPDIVASLVTPRGPDSSPAPRPSRTLVGEMFVNAKVVGAEGEYEAWMIEPREGVDALVIIGYSQTGLARIIAQRGSGSEWILSGGWAEYVLPQIGSIQYGTLEGSMHWPNLDAEMLVTLKKLRERDNETSSLTMVCSPTTSPGDRQSYLREFESSGLLQSLLYSELFPRNLAWAIEMEAMLPARSGTRYFIPDANGLMNVDGVLDEEFWTERYFRPGTGRIGEYTATHGEVRSMLKARWSGDSVRMSARVARAREDAIWEIAILPAFEVSIQDSARFLIRVDAAGRATYRYYLGEVEQPVTYNWPAATGGQDAGESILELEIPCDTLAPSAQPAPGKRWRVNIQCFQEDVEGKRHTIAHWGEQDIMSLDHGALFLFEEGGS